MGRSREEMKSVDAKLFPPDKLAAASSELKCAV